MNGVGRDLEGAPEGSGALFDAVREFVEECWDGVSLDTISPGGLLVNPVSLPNGASICIKNGSLVVSNSRDENDRDFLKALFDFIANQRFSVPLVLSLAQVKDGDFDLVGGADFSKVVFRTANFQSDDFFHNVNFRGAKFEKCGFWRFVNVDLRGAIFEECRPLIRLLQNVDVGADQLEGLGLKAANLNFFASIIFAGLKVHGPVSVVFLDFLAALKKKQVYLCDSGLCDEADSIQFVDTGGVLEFSLPGTERALAASGVPEMLAKAHPPIDTISNASVIFMYFSRGGLEVRRFLKCVISAVIEVRETDTCRNKTFEDCDFKGFDFNETWKHKRPFENCVFEGVKFEGCDFRGVDFANSVFKDCEFVVCDLRRANFAQSTFSGTWKFEDCNLGFFWTTPRFPQGFDPKAQFTARGALAVVEDGGAVGGLSDPVNDGRLGRTPNHDGPLNPQAPRR